MRGILKPGTIVKAHYGKFEGKQDVGIFCVIYDESLDSNTINKYNVVACKITTSLTAANSYSVCLADGKNDFIKEKSFCQCSKLHTLDKGTQIFGRPIGQLHPDTLLKIYKQLERYNHELSQQMLSQI